MGRPARETKRINVILRFEPAVLLDLENYRLKRGITRHEAIMSLIIQAVCKAGEDRLHPDPVSVLKTSGSITPKVAASFGPQRATPGSLLKKR